MANIFNSDLLLVARQFRSLSQADVASRAGLNQGHYSKIERGILNAPPTVETISKLASALDFPEQFFTQTDELTGLPLSVHDAAWRKKASTGATEIKRLHAELNLRLMHLRRFLEAVDIDPELPCPRIDVDEAGGVEKVAALVRRAWLIPDGPIKNLTAYCEKAGIVVIHCDFQEKIDGVTMRLRDLPPIIFLNRSAPADRMRHSLAHELGHLIMHSVPSDEMEDEADTFAGELLAPIREVRADLIGTRVTLERLVQLKQYWRVSVAALLYRSGKYGLISQNQSSYLWRQLSSLGWRKSEPDETQFDREVPKLFPRVLELHESDLAYDIEDFSNMLRFSKNDVRKLYGVSNNGERRHLSVVRS